MSENEFFVPTRASLHKKVPVDFQTVVHVSRKRKAKDQKEKPAEKETGESENTVNVKRLKHEVMRFGMSGFAPKDAKEAKIQLAVKLGAKPLKNKYTNYKTLIQERKRAKQKEELEKQQFKVRMNVKPKLPGKKQKKSVKGSLLGVYGKVDKDKIKIKK